MLNSMRSRPVILVFDSGFGGLTVYEAVRAARPDADYIYCADDAGFPYGALPEEVLTERLLAVFDRLIAEFSPDLAVIACNTASTIGLAALRASFEIPFVGTVPAIKPAAEASVSRIIAVLATAGTVRREYTRSLIDRFAAHCRVELVGSIHLASLAEARLRGEAVPDAAILAEIMPCFVEEEGRRTDQLVLGCTHYPLLADEIARLAPWPLTLVDPAPAIARRVVALLGAGGEGRRDLNGVAVFTGRLPEGAAERYVLQRYGVGGFSLISLPLDLSLKSASSAR